MEKTIEIPEGYEARIEGNKVVLEQKESEDERIRKELIEYLTHRAEVTGFINEDRDCKRWIAWLEKRKEPENTSASTMVPSCWEVEQKEQKYSPLCNTVKDKIREYIANHFITDTVVKTDVKSIVKAMEEGVRLGKEELIPYKDLVHKGDNNNPYDMQSSEALEYAIKRGFGVPFNDNEVYVNIRHMTQTIGNIIRWADEHPKEQKITEWSEEDDAAHTRILGAVAKAFMGVLPTKPSEEDVHWLKTLPERFNLQPKQEWSREDEKMVLFWNMYYEHKVGDWSNKDVIEHLERFQEWFNNRFRSLCSQLKQEWNEEDEKDMAHIIQILDDCYAYGKHDLSKTDHENLVNKLKSLCSRPKTSDNQKPIPSVKKGV